MNVCINVSILVHIYWIVSIDGQNSKIVSKSDCDNKIVNTIHSDTKSCGHLVSYKLGAPQKPVIPGCSQC